MFLFRSLVVIHLFIIPFLFHPLTICRHLIHIGHEPFPAKSLQRNSFEFVLYNLFQSSKSYLKIYPLVKKENRFRRLWNRFFGRKDDFLKNSFYPNLFQYTVMYLFSYDFSPMIRSFLFMSISHFLLTYFASLVHVYRISLRRKNRSLQDIRIRVKESIESSYGRWILSALLWKSLGVIISHVFYVMAVKVLMQTLLLNYEDLYLNKDLFYSSWNIYRNLQLICRHRGWTILYSGLLSRMIYELGKSIEIIFCLVACCCLGLTLFPRLIWWPFRRYFIRSTLECYFRASSIELYFLQCLGENLLRCFSIYLQIFARLSTLEIVNEMSESINRKAYPLLLLFREYSIEQPWSLFIPMHLIDAKLITNGLSLFYRQAN